MPETTVSRLAAATIQLDWAVKLLIDRRAFVPAITLAAAADEMVASELRKEDKERPVAHTLIRDEVSKKYELTPKEVSDGHLNKVKNWLKHGSEDVLSHDWEQQTVQQITRAFLNMQMQHGSMPGEGRRFFKWAIANASRLDIDIPPLVRTLFK